VPSKDVKPGLGAIFWRFLAKGQMMVTRELVKRPMAGRREFKIVFTEGERGEVSPFIFLLEAVYLGDTAPCQPVLEIKSYRDVHPCAS
jgi:hypothetical protein